MSEKNGYQKTAKVVRIRTNVSNDEVLSLECFLSVGVAVDKGSVVRSDVLQQFLIRIVQDATIVETGNRHAVKRRRWVCLRILASSIEILRLCLGKVKISSYEGG